MTSEQAWSALLALLSDGPKDPELDTMLARFVRAHPGALERQIIARLGELARRGVLAELLGHDLVTSWPSDHQRTLEAIDPALGLRIFAVSQLDHADELDWAVTHNSFNLAASWAKRAGWEAVLGLGLPPQMLDSLRWIVERTPPPDVLPRETAFMTADEIEARIGAYVGSLPSLLERLRPGGCSESGFLAKGERLGDVIARDARALAQLGIDRHGFTARALEVLRARDRPPYRVEVNCFQGHVRDPFHTYDLYEAHGGAMSFEIVRGDRPDHARLSGGDLTLTLIRRFGFFQGSVPNRIDPVEAARVLFD